MRVLVVESDDRIAEGLRSAGLDVATGPPGGDAQGAAEGGSFDGIVLSLSRTAESLTICDALRRKQVSAPVIVLVQNDAVEVRLEALEAGADMCLAGGCAVEELLARLRALVRRSALDAARSSA